MPTMNVHQYALNLIGKKNRNTLPLFFIFLMTALLIGLSGCEQGPRDIRIGEQECDHCRMMVSDERFASQLITGQGRQFAFDSIECLAAYVNDGDGQELDIAGLWVPDFDHRGEWRAAEKAVYLQSDELRSPMALNFSAYADHQTAEDRVDEFGGHILDWQGVQRIVQEEWSGGHH